MAQALYRKWRPQRWEEVIGQDHVIQTLRNAVESGRTAHAYLFAGPRGTGKTSTARLLAKALNCEAESLAARPCNQCGPCLALQEGRFLDLIEIDAASNTSVEDVRDLRDKINFSPNEGRFKVYIIDEVHMLSTAAFNALLKTLEEPPQHAVFILATTEAHKIPATVLSRCQRHEFRRLPMEMMVSFLQTKVAEEGYVVDEAALELIARQATGSMRDAISLLDQLASTGEAVTLAQAQTVLGTASTEAVRSLVGAWAEGAPGRGLEVINRALDAGTDERQLARQVVDYLRGMLLVHLGNAALLDVTEDQRTEMVVRMETVGLERLMQALQAFNRAASEKRGSWQRALPLEMALVESTPFSHRPPQATMSGGERAGAGAPEEAPPSAEEPPGRVKDELTPQMAAHAEAKSADGEVPSAEAPSGEAASGETLADEGQPEETPPAEPAEPAAAPEAGAVTFAKMVDHWRDVLRAARRHDPQTQALLNSSKPLGLEDTILIIGFSSDLLREKMERAENIARAGQALHDVFGETIGIRCVLSSTWQSDKDVESEPVDMEDGGMVATALKDLGAQVVGVDDLAPGKKASD